MTLEETLDGLASESPAPGAGAAAAWCCALSAALVEMVARVLRARGEGSPELERRRNRAGELRAAALRLADEDAAAYRAVIDAPPERRREALSAAADPPLAIAEAAAETGALAVCLGGGRQTGRFEARRTRQRSWRPQRSVPRPGSSSSTSAGLRTTRD